MNLTLDFIIDVASVNLRMHEQEAASRDAVDALANFYQQERTKEQQQSTSPHATSSSKKDGVTSGDSLGTEIPHYAGFFVATTVLTQRMFKNAFRQRGAYLNRIIEPLGVSIIPALFYWGFEDSPEGLLSRIGFLHQIMGSALAGLIIHTEVFPKEARRALCRAQE